MFEFSERLISFLDDTGALKLVDLAKIDYSSAEALCFFINVFHTLLLHARLVLGCPNEEVHYLHCLEIVVVNLFRLDLVNFF
jgi:hypothetical protein